MPKTGLEGGRSKDKYIYCGNSGCKPWLFPDAMCFVSAAPAKGGGVGHDEALDAAVVQQQSARGGEASRERVLGS